MAPSKPFFPKSYTEARVWFRGQLGSIQAYWPEATLFTHKLEEHPDLSLDWIDTSPSKPSDRLFILSTGLHGIEGYPGTAFLHHFVTQYLHLIDPLDVDLLLVHSVNPWGMQHRRRPNANNIDLNRNFRFGNTDQSTIDNPGYPKLQALLNPVQRLRRINVERLRFLLKLLASAARYGVKQIKEATLLGQTSDPQGLYFGGYQLQEETTVLWNLVTEKIKVNQQVIHIDIHTGYGASRRLYLVNSIHEITSPDVWSERFKFSDVLRTDPGDFYAIKGDMIDAFYAWNKIHGIRQNYFGTAFEFGTLGEHLPAIIRSLRAVVFENRLFHYGTNSPHVQEVVEREFVELFMPASTDWWDAVVRSSDQALHGIFSYFGLLRPG